MMDDSEVKKYINKSIIDIQVSIKEDQLLYILRYRNEIEPSEENDNNWKEFSSFVIKRRYGIE